MGKRIKIKIEKEEVNDLDKILLLGLAFMWEVEEKEGFLPIEKEKMHDIVEKVRRQLEPYCKKEKMSKHNHIRYLKFRLEQAGIQLVDMNNNDREKVVDSDTL